MRCPCDLNVHETRAIRRRCEIAYQARKIRFKRFVKSSKTQKIIVFATRSIQIVSSTQLIASRDPVLPYIGHSIVPYRTRLFKNTLLVFPWPCDHWAVTMAVRVFPEISNKSLAYFRSWFVIKDVTTARGVWEVINKKCFYFWETIIFTLMLYYKRNSFGFKIWNISGKVQILH